MAKVDRVSEGLELQQPSALENEQLGAVLDEIVRRIVVVAQPEKIIVFGSAARGELGPNSDIDLLVIKSGANRLDLMGEIYAHLHGVGVAVDVIVVRPEDVERYASSPALVIAPALREGRVVYAS